MRKLLALSGMMCILLLFKGPEFVQWKMASRLLGSSDGETFQPAPAERPANSAPPSNTMALSLPEKTPPAAVTDVQATVTALAGTLTALPAYDPTPTVTPLPTFTSPPPPTPTLPEIPLPAPHVFPLVPAEVAHYNMGHHDYPATDIFAPAGTWFVAVTDGVIEEVSREDLWHAGNDGLCTRGGLYVSLVGDDGVRYYGSHLATVAPEIRPGARVVAGQPLGTVGNSGNARGVPPHLHFGISRPTGPGDCGVRRGEVWPYSYLNQWKAGQNVIPVLPAQQEEG